MLSDWVTPVLAQAGYERRRSNYRHVDSRGTVAVHAWNSPRLAGHTCFRVQVCVSPAAYLRYEYREDEAALDSWTPADTVGLAWTRLKHDPILNAELAPTAVRHAGGVLVDETASDLWTFPQERDDVYVAVGTALRAALSGGVLVDAAGMLDPATVLAAIDEFGRSRWMFSMGRQWAQAITLSAWGPSDRLTSVLDAIAAERPDSPVLAWVARELER